MSEDFYDETVNNNMSKAISGKTVASCKIEDDRADQYFIFEFTDGTKLRILYDYIYEWEVK